ncbi:MAG TPA: cytochrome c maturation protein CcmE [Caulobacteraceae bacterium]|jgi:cytochrome c-type biogenesis protein CcmE|nr:cytochrome c maturation protein CcmE [Caulobacteraceae bacterium]
MAWLPKSRTARRRFLVVAAAAPILALAAGLTLYGLRSSISYFYTPAQAEAAHVPAGQAIQLGGLVDKGSVAKAPDGAVRFVVSDRTAHAPVVFRGDLPDLFREGQGVVAIGAFNERGVFVASSILAKHDERYMPRELSRALKARGEWRGEGAMPRYDQGGPT